MASCALLPRLVALACIGLGCNACTHDGVSETPHASDDASDDGAGGAGGGGGSGGSGGLSGSGGAGGSVPCVEDTAESTTATCSDACDNDGNGVDDCDDANCCALGLGCASSTFCGQRPEGNAWEGSLELDDSQVAELDPSELPAGIEPCHAPALVRVGYAVDGDTLDVTDESGGDANGRVRVIGIDTPEVAHGESPEECFGNEAWAFTSQLTDRLVWLTFDAECRDTYDRLLAYVHVGPGVNDSLERQLLRRGLARAFPYGDNRTFEDLFESDEQQAKASAEGMWGACP